jgi:lipoprotein-anchoring transpeptidase ErfK/SrfK
MTRRYMVVMALVAATTTAGCRVTDRTDDDADRTTQPTAQPPGTQPYPDAQAQQPQGELSLEVNLAARELYVQHGGQRVETYRVAVGSSEWPTRTGDWTIEEVVFNPRWVPPEEEWAEDEDEVEPGDPENPLGRVQLIYDRPRSIHGTNEPESIGQAVSHGSIRMTNESALELARAVMQAGGATNGEEQLRRAEQNPRQSYTVPLTRPVPIRVVDRSATSQGQPGGR